MFVLVRGLLPFCLSIFFMAVNADAFPLNASKVQGPEECAECHKDSTRLWQQTPHATEFRNLARSESGKAITKALDIRRIKTEESCMGCHFTPIDKDGRMKVIAGISCESCHSEGAGWMKVHNDYGGKTVTRETEDPAHKAARLAKMEASSMIRPSHLYEWAENCLQCHVVGDEKIVNTGGHPALSKGFELLAWSQGTVRHNVWYSKGKENVEASPEKKRMIYVMGKAVGLEHALRGLAAASTSGALSQAMTDAVNAYKKDLTAIQNKVSIPEVATMLTTVNSVSLAAGNASELNGAADRVAKAAKSLEKSHDGAKLAALDGLLPSPASYK